MGPLRNCDRVEIPPLPPLSCAPPVLSQLLPADDPLLADIRLAPRSLKTERLPGGSGDPSGLQKPGFPGNRAHGSNAQGTQPRCCLRTKTQYLKKKKKKKAKGCLLFAVAVYLTKEDDNLAFPIQLLFLDRPPFPPRRPSVSTKESLSSP